jgi:hypothetical protein
LASAGEDLKGRNGVAVLSRHPIKSVRDLGADEFALHGRYVEVDIDGLTVASVYIQAGDAGTDRQLDKERFMAALAHRMATLTDRDAVVCGDWNVAHTENDIKNWKGNVKKSGILPAERQWLTELSSSQAAGTPTRRAGPTWFGSCILTCPVRIRGGRGAGGRSTRRGLAHRLPIPRKRECPHAPQRAGGAGQRRAGRTRRGLCASLVRPRAGDRRVRHGGYPLMSATETAHRNQVRRKGVG